MPTSDATAAVRALARASRLLERASDELPLAHYRVLSAVASGDERASRLARRLALGKPAISSAVEALNQRGLLERRAVEDDQRASALIVTPEGHQVLTRVESAMVERLQLLLARTSDPSQVLAALAQLDDAMEQVMSELAAERSR